jgi:2',3'-cyclic-nucleotide 2'-phosphodiesterase (5'-nucleotidase family)
MVEKNVLLFDTGDILDIIDNSMLHAYVYKIYGILNYDAWISGDQDFIEGPEFFLNNLLTLKMKFLNTNIAYNGELIGENYTIYKFGNISIGVTGSINETFYRYLPPSAQKVFSFDNQKQSLLPVLQEMSTACDFNILLSHSGYRRDKELAVAYPELDLIVGAHSQTLIKKEERIGKTMLVQAGENGYRVGVLSLNFSEKKLKSVDNNIYLLKKTSSDHPEVKKLIQEYYHKRKIKNRLDNTINN